MNGLSPMTEIIALSAATIGGEEIQTVNARDLHAFLGVKTEFKDSVFAAW